MCQDTPFSEAPLNRNNVKILQSLPSIELFACPTCECSISNCQRTLERKSHMEGSKVGFINGFGLDDETPRYSWGFFLLQLPPARDTSGTPRGYPFCSDQVGATDPELVMPFHRCAKEGLPATPSTSGVSDDDILNFVPVSSLYCGLYPYATDIIDST